MSDEFSRAEIRTYYSNDESDLFVLTGPLPRLQLKEEPEPSDAPLYIDLENNEAYHPSSVAEATAEQVVKYAEDESTGVSVSELSEDTDTWYEEFSELFNAFEEDTVESYSFNLDKNPDAGSPDSSF